MALTCGFFNSINKDRLYDAIQFGQIFDGIIADGVYATYLKGMVVIASDNPNEVIIQPGRAWFNHTWSYNDANLPFEAPEPEVLLDRIDTLVLDVNLEQAERNNTYIWVQGTPSSQNPQPPALIRSVTHNQYPLCDVYRKAGTTMIYTKDITNRIGTSDTPFATGVLEGIDLDMWINQWDNEFHTWEIDTKAEFDAWELNSKNSFETWMISQQQVYTAWFDSIKDQMSDDLAEFEAWFETIKDIIDESAALHLQAEIDEINKKLPSGSHITITTENTELFGRNVTVTDGTHPTIVKFDNSGVAEVETYPYVGNITITSTDGIRTATTTTHIPYFGRYSYGISFWAAVVNIIGDEEFANYPVTVKNSNGDILTTIILDSSAQGTWTAIEPDTYTFSVTYGGETMEVSLNVTQETTYTVEIHAQPAGFDFEEWLTAGDVSGTYADLDAVLADEVAVRKLMTKHASVDYLASFTSDDASVVTILNNDLCAKWISLRDYAMDVLEAVYGTLMGTIGKYGYGEWALLPQVPTMTSDTTPSGECLASSVYSGRYYWYGFRYDTEPVATNGTTFWTTEAKGAGQWLGYDFKKPVLVRKCTFRPYETNGKIVQVQGTNDISGTWYDIGEPKTLTGTQFGEETITMPNNSTEYRYYRLYMVTAASSGHATAQLQFYAWAPKGAVPIMTGNTAPYGEASASSEYTEAYCYTWRAFDPSLQKGWMAVSSGWNKNSHLSYAFVNPVLVKKAKVGLVLSSNGANTIYFKIQGSNDNFNSDINDLCIEQTLNATTLNSTTYLDVPLENDRYYLKYRLFMTMPSSNNNGIGLKLQFYGRELKVSVPTMTGNTTPYGEASANNTAGTGYEAYKAFDNNEGTYFSTDNSVYGENYKLQYEFPNPVVAKEFGLTEGRSYSTSTSIPNHTIHIEGSNDGTTWTPILEKSSTASDNLKFEILSTNNNTAYKKYRIWSNTYNWCYMGDRYYYYYVITTFQIYGVDYSERDWDTEHPRHYIYDHGVELDTFVKASYSDSSTVVEKRPSEILLQIPSPSGSKQSGIVKTIDLTDYELMRMCVGDEYVNGTYESLGIYSNSFSILVSRLRPLSNMPYNTGLDIASADSTYEIVIETSNKLTVTEWWLE